MARFGTPSEAKDFIIAPAIYTGSLQCGLYTNTADSLGTSSVLADITEPSGTGYARASLNGSWSFSGGIVTYSPVVQFENTGAGDWTGAVVGAFLTDGTYLLHFLDRSSGSVTVGAGDIVEVDISALVD